MPFTLPRYINRNQHTRLSAMQKARDELQATADERWPDVEVTVHPYGDIFYAEVWDQTDANGRRAARIVQLAHQEDYL